MVTPRHRSFTRNSHGANSRASLSLSRSRDLFVPFSYYYYYYLVVPGPSSAPVTRLVGSRHDLNSLGATSVLNSDARSRIRTRAEKSMRERRLPVSAMLVVVTLDRRATCLTCNHLLVRAEAASTSKKKSNRRKKSRDHPSRNFSSALTLQIPYNWRNQ